MISYLEPNIVIIDDIKEEINGILEIYSNKNIGCKLFNPDYIDGDLMPDKTFSDVSLIFLDLFYSEKFDAEQSCNWIRSIIAEKSFYVIVFWTKDPSKSDEVLQLLIKNNRTPFISFTESKSNYITEEGKYDFSSLIDKIDKEFINAPSIEEILIWKKSIKNSTNEVLGHLAKHPNNISDKLKKIILSHGGKSVINLSDKNKREVLFDALNIVLTSNTKQSIVDEISQLNKDSLYNLAQIPEQENPDKELNSWFHFKLGKEISNELILPGLISSFEENDWKKMYSIEDDPNVCEYISKQNQDGTKIFSIVMVLSRPCDIAQKKFGKNIKLLSGLKIVNPVRKTNNTFQGGSSKPDSIRIYDHLYFDEMENDISIIFDFRYSFSVPEEIFIKDFRNIKIFNKELLSELQVEYSSYSSRLGITQIL